MNMLNRFTLCGCALLLCFSLSAAADELQDINKLFKQGEQEQALARVNTYLSSKPKDAQARFLKGLILTEQNKTNDAIRVFTDLTEDYPELPEPYNNLAVLYASQGQYDKARIALEMAIRTHPSYATAHENLGDIYAKMASQAYDRALQLDRGNTTTQTKLSMLNDIFSARSGKPAKASRKQQAAAETAPAPAEATAQPGAAPATEKPATAHKLAASDKEAVLKAVRNWAAAWSGRDVKSYLAFYAPDFRTPDGIGRAEWEAQRNERIRKPKSIQVSIGNVQAMLSDDSHASVTFRQSYRASHMKTSSTKTLLMVKSGGAWLIQEERTGK